MKNGNLNNYFQKDDIVFCRKGRKSSPVTFDDMGKIGFMNCDTENKAGYYFIRAVHEMDKVYKLYGERTIKDIYSDIEFPELVSVFRKNGYDLSGMHRFGILNGEKQVYAYNVNTGVFINASTFEGRMNNVSAYIPNLDYTKVEKGLREASRYLTVVELMDFDEGGLRYVNELLSYSGGPQWHPSVYPIAWCYDDVKDSKPEDVKRLWEESIMRCRNLMEYEDFFQMFGECNRVKTLFSNENS